MPVQEATLQNVMHRLIITPATTQRLSNNIHSTQVGPNSGVIKNQTGNHRRGSPDHRRGLVLVGLVFRFRRNSNTWVLYLIGVRRGTRTLGMFLKDAKPNSTLRSPLLELLGDLIPTTC
jgi:hypothetical protein